MKIPVVILCILFLLAELKFSISEYPWLDDLNLYLNLLGNLMVLLWLVSITSIGINRHHSINRFSKLYNWIDILWISIIGLIILMLNISSGSIKESISFGEVTFSFSMTRPPEIMYLIILLGFILLAIIAVLYQDSILKQRPKLLKSILIMLLLFFPYIGVWVINKKIKTEANKIYKE